MFEFPKDFLWGAATSSYQVEGGNFNCDWAEWEKRTGKEQCGSACRHYELFQKDFDLAASLHHNAHRFSVEWSRIEPSEGEFSEEALDHYREVVRALRKRRIEPVVTLHHFTNPLWISARGGWLDKRTIGSFRVFVEKVVEALAGEVTYWVTINEPLVFVCHSYLLGFWPPGEKSFPKAKQVTENLVQAHIQSYQVIHELYRRRGLSSPLVSIAKNVRLFQPQGKSLRNRFAAFLRDRDFNFSFVEKLAKHKTLDYLGLNYYSRELVDIHGWSRRNFFFDVSFQPEPGIEKNSLGWDIYPEGLFELLMKFSRFHIPLLITENGICTDSDEQRWRFIREHLISVHRALAQGAEVRGYLYWSLIDNFEWDKGFAPRFGLIEMDYKTQQRSVRESAQVFAAVCKTGQLT